MALPSSPPISSNQIQSEFGGSSPFTITDYYRGGSLVPNISQNNGVPTSGPISILDFLGATNQAPLSATTPSNVFGIAIQIPGTATSTPAQVVATGGTGSYTYLWQYVSGDTGIFTVDNTSSSSMRWGRSITSPSQSYEAVWRCRVQSGGVTVYTNNVTVTLTGSL